MFLRKQGYDVLKILCEENKSIKLQMMFATSNEIQRKTPL